MTRIYYDRIYGPGSDSGKGGKHVYRVDAAKPNTTEKVKSTEIEFDKMDGWDMPCPLSQNKATIRYTSLQSALAAAVTEDACHGVVKDEGVSVGGALMQYELRTMPLDAEGPGYFKAGKQTVLWKKSTKTLASASRSSARAEESETTGGVKELKPEEMRGRISGSVAWRSARGELGGKVSAAKASSPSMTSISEARKFGGGGGDNSNATPQSKSRHLRGSAASKKQATSPIKFDFAAFVKEAHARHMNEGMDANAAALTAIAEAKAALAALKN